MIQTLTRHQPGEPSPAPNMLLSSPGPASPVATNPSGGASPIAPEPLPAAAASVRSRPPRARRAPPIPGRGRTGSRCSAQRRLHPRVWSQARPGPAGGGGGGSGGGILRLPRLPPRPPSSLLLYRLRAPLTGPCSWPGDESLSRLGRRRAFSGAGHRTGDPGAPGQGPGPRAPQPRGPEKSSSRRRRSLTERPPARLES